MRHTVKSNTSFGAENRWARWGTSLGHRYRLHGWAGTVCHTGRLAPSCTYPFVNDSLGPYTVPGAAVRTGDTTATSCLGGLNILPVVSKQTNNPVSGSHESCGRTGRLHTRASMTDAWEDCPFTVEDTSLARRRQEQWVRARWAPDSDRDAIPREPRELRRTMPHCDREQPSQSAGSQVRGVVLSRSRGPTKKQWWGSERWQGRHRGLWLQNGKTGPGLGHLQAGELLCRDAPGAVPRPPGTGPRNLGRSRLEGSEAQPERPARPPGR